MIAAPVVLGVGVPSAQAKNGDTHITGQGINQTIDCNESTLFVMGTGNTINALGSCWAVTVQGSSNIVIADNIVDNVIVYGSDQTVFYKGGDPVVWDRGRELGMVNRIDRVPA
jgi:Ca2+-binding RTX toxin-like protein